MSDWRVIQDLAAGEAMLAEVRTRLTSTGAEKIAAEASVAMEQAAMGAFSSKVDPRTGKTWAPASEATLRDRLRQDESHRFKSLLVRSGELESNIVSGYKVTPGGATAFINAQASVVRKASILLYGVRARLQKSNKAYRKNPDAAMPGRRFVGLSDQKVGEIMRDAEQIITGGL